MLGIWPGYDTSSLNLKSDFRTTLNQIRGWNLTALISRSLTFDETIIQTTNKHFDIIYLASHSSGEIIEFNEDEVSIYSFASFCKQKQARLVVLGVCRGGDLARLLLSVGIDTVIFWADTVADEDAIRVARLLFFSLSEGSTANVAVENARMPLKDWVKHSLEVRGYQGLRFEGKGNSLKKTDNKEN